MSWPEPPDWLRLEVEPRRLARGTGERGDPGGRFRMDRQILEYADWRPAENATAEFTVPAEAPYSYEGEVVSFYWGIWLRREGRVLDREAYVPLVVEP